MATQYGYRIPGAFGGDFWSKDKASAESTARRLGGTLIAREVSEPRIVSIRA